MTSHPLSRRSLLAGTVAAGAFTVLGSGQDAAAAQPLTATTNPQITVVGEPSAEAERLRLAQALRGSEFQPTGRYASPGAAVTLRVEAGGGLIPTLWIGQWDYYNDDDTLQQPRKYTLTTGDNTVSDPHGGPVYLSLAGDGERSRVRFLSGTREIPAFRLGERDAEARFQKRLDAGAGLPVVELYSPHAIVTLTREGALLHRSQDHSALLGLYETIIDSHARISGLDGSKPQHARKAGRYHFTEVSKVPSGVGAYATHGYNGFPRAYLDRALTVEGLRTRGWGLYHELGHLHQQFAYKAEALTEVTVNIYSLAAQRTLDQPSNLLTPDAATGLNPFQSSRAKFGTAGLSYEKSFGAYEKLVPLRQLELAFGDDFWPRLHRLVREENPRSDHTDSAKRYRALATYSSRIARHDLTDFYVHTWAFPIDATGKAELAALGLPRPAVDPGTLSD
ncbi:M60 family metallopeptidase [Streptomyces tsukubensis]|uniref:Peptidase M60 domain-containing protein n=1 Tax=Streptomyces tsukubensis TaxID=83656 RepID=A0A1V4A9R2_9ACTN|nr:M60 family metallopeptidase [Streptomyces tsukubensis]OON80044.1 hypothetical protein B1H18_12740 [Streptomyces tsukubensis]QFR97279.1 hypothetical protein GBW32_34705 [Streptomyces tsukubensis]